ncbi:hypothetical protein [uncultured Acinetobacter sp.]|uniref:hypothetical protein n=1 Tax=uncultured Acinetobacter sp. TaxID=165433 RepID=UPI002614BA2C|nr:hypothetical protein [uncultured Acinetobacter sp.]
MTQIGPVVMPPNELKSGIKTLKKRQRHFNWLFLAAASLLIATFITSFLQHDLVYSFFGLYHELKQLHIPISAEHIGLINTEQDYFMSLLGWFAWLIFKVCVSFVGAFFMVYLLKKLRFFYVRFQSFVLKFVGWLLAFMLLWSGLTYVQHDLNQDQSEFYQGLTSYSQQISDSEIYQQLQGSQTPSIVQAYLLAQTALLQQPADLVTAKPYLQHLVTAEQYDPRFDQYGFDPKQLWSMQQQLYARTVTPVTQALQPEVTHAEQRQQQLATLLIISGGLWLGLSVLFWLLGQYFKRRVQRIEQRLTA